jgi:hypothetical protein
MSEFGAEQAMRHAGSLTDADITDLLDGDASLEASDLRELAAFFGELRSVLSVPPDVVTEQRHLSAISDQVARSRAPVPTRRRAVMAIPAKLLAAAGVSLASFGGVAYAGALPPPVQHAVADVAGRIGLSLPGQHNDVDNGAVNQVDGSHQSNTDAGHVNQLDGGQQSNIDNGHVGQLDGGEQSNIDYGPVGQLDGGQLSNIDNGPVGG